MIDTRKVIESMAEMVINLSIGFRSHNNQLLSKIKQDSLSLEQKNKIIRDDQYVKHIETARQNLDNVIAAVEKKVAGSVLFSETAAREMDTLFNGLIGFLDHVKDYLLTGNKVLGRHIKDEADKHARYAREFATKHEERLIQGVCQPRAAAVYLDMLSGFSGIFYNLSRIAE